MMTQGGVIQWIRTVNPFINKTHFYKPLSIEKIILRIFLFLFLFTFQEIWKNPQSYNRWTIFFPTLPSLQQADKERDVKLEIHFSFLYNFKKLNIEYSPLVKYSVLLLNQTTSFRMDSIRHCHEDRFNVVKYRLESIKDDAIWPNKLSKVFWTVRLYPISCSKLYVLCWGVQPLLLSTPPP